MDRFIRYLQILVMFWALAALSPSSACAGDLSVEITGRPSILFDTAIDQCAPIDVPDLNARAFRDASGEIVMFALHYINRPLRGPDLAHMKLDCHVSLGSSLDGDPSHYADRNFVTSTWTTNGRDVAALVHHEYHADDFGRCTASSVLGCWYNTIVGYQSSDGGRSFERDRPFVVAAAPFGQDREQGRHRGFFNPSNIVADGRYFYALVSTTGWDGQDFGNCLFRTDDPMRAGSWRAFDGKDFSIRYADPYVAKNGEPVAPCHIVGPFVYPVGALVRHARTKTWIAVFQAAAGGDFITDGFYYATSRDLLIWSVPRLLLPQKTLFSDLCRAGPSVVGYPSIIDGGSTSRNFDQVGDHPDLIFAQMDVAHCATGQRLLVREGLTIQEGDRS